MTIETKTPVIPNSASDIGFFTTKLAAMGSNGQPEFFSFPSQPARVQSAQIVSTGMSSLAGVNVTVDDSLFFVGPDSALHTKGRESRTISENFAKTSEYKALFLGSLHYLLRIHSKTVGDSNKVDIRRLVVGLPLNTFMEMKQYIREIFEGKHKVPSTIKHNETVEVHVKSVTVIPQPQGALISSGVKITEKAAMAEYYSQNILVIDLGGGTCDWLLTNNQKVISSRSGAYQKGVLACVYAICDSINKTFATDPLAVQRIDDALRNGKAEFKLGGGNVYKLQDYKQAAQHVLYECLNQIITSVGSLTSVDQIIFTGGGGKLLYEAAQEAWSEYEKIMVIDDNSVFSNVYGFFLLGEMLNG
ncbi:ParM/StbA family protein [Comamonas sp. w2-DMI]|uniref:ParM/StbA family protein n=1 Tax=Comamonas sp. w2-DMI TaxID=3126391 RepID=UPI0032E4B370